VPIYSNVEQETQKVKVKVKVQVKVKLKVKVTGLELTRGFQEVKVPRFHDNGTGWW